ncbi:hypothetical protein GLOIN_2v1873913 [Rhizophagus irregularis DAOM 181602=DAOM 197198]|nr:hypothetical protein RhiirB3_454936 [Rhizophagus irregularis]GET61759.1 hypothetical protein GLOIN_2v1873913 [Rhizophagus irregularis DAOM 181602=DAOM 197198]
MNYEVEPRFLGEVTSNSLRIRLVKDWLIFFNDEIILCNNVCDSLVFILRGYVYNHHNQDNHLKRCISGNTISNVYAVYV